jgi:uncharacterized protein (DUF2336 family)
MPHSTTLIDELEDTIASGTARHRLMVLQRITDLFVSGSRQYSNEQIALFDDVLLRLTAEIEVKARAKLADRLAGMSNAPPKLIRLLAFDDAIEVAGPVLTTSSQLSDNDLVDNANTKSQDHLYAISQRLKLSEAVTDVLVDRGNRRVVLSVAGNTGACISLAGFGKLVARARRDETLAYTVGSRDDIPRHHFLKLLQTASASVRTKLETANPEAAAEIKETVAEVADTMQREVREASREHARATKAVKRRYKTHQLTEANVHASALSQEFEKTVVALSLLGPFPVDLVERALLDEGPNIVLILCKAAGCSRTTAKAILLMQAANRGMSEQDLENALMSFDRLSTETAKRVLKFHETRHKAHEEETAAALEQAESEQPAASSDPELRTGT